MLAPESHISDTEAMPVPPPRTLLSPINSSRRATSLKTKEGTCEEYSSGRNKPAAVEQHAR